MSMTEASESYFAREAENWDRLRTGYFTESVREAAIQKAYLRPEMIVADVGAGTGFVSAGLAPLVAQVHVLDGSAEMLAVAQRNLKGFNNLTYHEADGAALPLEDGSMDAVFANMYLHHCPDPQAAVREMVRILRPGGRLVITDMDRHDHKWMLEEMADQWLGFDRPRVKAWLREAGLVNVIVDCTGEACCATSQADSGTETETPAQRSGARARVSVFVATGSKRVTGVRDAVQASYGAVAEGSSCGCGGSQTTTQAVDTSQDIIPLASSCCCSPNAMEQVDGGVSDGILYDTGYHPEQLASVPAEAVELSLGCGNPTAMASLQPGQVVLDIGSGAGIDAFYAARRVGPTGRVIGLDMTPAMIQRAQQSAEASGIANVDFRLGNAEAMPVEDATVDVILSNCVINLVEDKGRVFEEAYRVLRDGGRLSISDMVTDRPLPLDFRGDPQLWAGCINGALPEEEYLELIKQAGFSDIVAHRTLSGGRIGSVEVYSLAVSARKGHAATSCCG